MTDRKDVIRQAVTNSRRGHASLDYTTALLATGGSTRSLIDTLGLQGQSISKSRFHNHWLWLPTAAAADEIRICRHDGFLAQSSEVIIAEEEAAYASAITNEQYLIVRDNPMHWKAALNAVLDVGLFERKTATWTPTNADRQSDPTAAPISASWLEHPSDVFDIELQITDTANALQWVSLDSLGRGWRLHRDAGVLELDFLSGDAPATTETLRLITVRNLDMVTAHGTAITADLRWMSWAMLAKMAEWLGDPLNARDDWTLIGDRAEVRQAGIRIQELGVLAQLKVRKDERVFGGPQLSGITRD